MFVSVVNIKFYVFSKMISILFIFGHSYWFKNNIIMVLWGLNYIFRMIKIDKTKNSLYRLSVSVSADMEINYRYRLSVSADMKIEFIGDYRYRPIWKKAYRSYPTWEAIKLHPFGMLASPVTCAKGVQFYCPSSTYAAIVLLVLYFID